jgi:hypothetical protein
MYELKFAWRHSTLIILSLIARRQSIAGSFQKLPNFAVKSVSIAGHRRSMCLATRSGYRSVCGWHLVFYIFVFFFCFGVTAPQWARASSFTGFLDHTQRRTTFSTTTLDEWSARRKDLYLTTHNTLNRKTPMLPVQFEPTILAGGRPPNYALDRTATGTGDFVHVMYIKDKQMQVFNIIFDLLWTGRGS